MFGKLTAWHFNSLLFPGDQTEKIKDLMAVYLPKGAARGGAEGAQAPPLAIRILMFIS